jgi:hypothetical protein
MREASPAQLPTEVLISPDFVEFTRDLVARDGVLDIYLHRSSGPVAVSGGEFGPQTIQAQAMANDLAVFLRSSLTALDAELDLDLRFVDQPEQADLRFYLDNNIDLGDGDLTLGIALSNPQPAGGFWEVMLNAPELLSQPDYLRYAALHEIGHALGLEHPFDDADGDLYRSTNPYRSAYPNDTLMAYREPSSGVWPTAYTSSDRAALRAIWGEQASPATNRLIGTPAADRLTGGPGNDELVGLAGPDQLRGGAGSNRFRAAADGDRDWIVISRDGSRRLARSARTVDVITELGREDRIAILGTRRHKISFRRLALDTPAYGPLEGVGIFASGRLEALYTADDLSRSQLSKLTFGLPTDTLA